jgi:hypothetical protein
MRARWGPSRDGPWTMRGHGRDVSGGPSGDWSPSPGGQARPRPPSPERSGRTGGRSASLSPCLPPNGGPLSLPVAPSRSRGRSAPTSTTAAWSPVGSASTGCISAVGLVASRAGDGRLAAGRHRRPVGPEVASLGDGRSRSFGRLDGRPVLVHRVVSLVTDRRPGRRDPVGVALPRRPRFEGAKPDPSGPPRAYLAAPVRPCVRRPSAGREGDRRRVLDSRRLPARRGRPGQH